MEIKKLCFEKKEIQFKEYYVDEDGKTRERMKTVMLPTGNILREDEEPAKTPDADASK